MKTLKGIIYILIVLTLLTGCSGLNSLKEIVNAETFSEEEKEEMVTYSNKMEENVKNFEVTMKEIAKISGKIADDPFGNNGENHLKLTIALAFLSVTIDETEKINVPEHLQNAHSDIELALRDYKKFSDDYLVSIVNFDSDRIKKNMDLAVTASENLVKGFNNSQEILNEIH